MGGAPSKKGAPTHPQSYVPPDENKDVARKIDFEDESDGEGEDSIEIQRHQMQERFASSDTSGRLALERLRQQEQANHSQLTNDEENLESLEADFMKVKTLLPNRGNGRNNSQERYSPNRSGNNVGDENGVSNDKAHSGLVEHTNKEELLAKIKQIAESGGGLEQLQFLLERATIIGIDESNPIMQQAYRVCNV